MFSALKLVLFLAFYGAVSSSEPVIVHELEAAEIQEFEAGPGIEVEVDDDQLLEAVEE